MKNQYRADDMVVAIEDRLTTDEDVPSRLQARLLIAACDASGRVPLLRCARAIYPIRWPLLISAPHVAAYTDCSLRARGPGRSPGKTGSAWGKAPSSSSARHGAK